MTNVDAEMDRLLQATFASMVEAMTDVRARNLVTSHLKSYQDVEPYLGNPDLIRKWYKAGEKSVAIIHQFIEDFGRVSHQLMGDGVEENLDRLVAIDYPFLTAEERAFVCRHFQSAGHYPMFFIAQAYLKQATGRSVEILLRTSGIVGLHDNMRLLAQEYGVTRERVRQLSVMSIVEDSPCPYVWAAERWAVYPFMGLRLLTADHLGWEELHSQEQLGPMDLHGALAILAQMRPLDIVALTDDGTKVSGRRWADKGWEDPTLVFAVDRSLHAFRIADAVATVGRQAVLQRIADKHMSLSTVVDSHISGQPGEGVRQQAMQVMAEVLPLLEQVEVEGDDIVLRQNRLNYGEVIYQILSRKGEPMKVDDIFVEFRRLHPEDHHTESGFLRSHLWRDERVEAVGSKSTYQLREWQLFAGALGDLAVHLLEGRPEPMSVDALCQQMLSNRAQTTLKSCATSIYLAVADGRLLYYVDTETTDTYVGLSQQTYGARFWPSTTTVEGTVRSLRRFLAENQRWPFPRHGGRIESSLSYALRKHTERLHVTDDECRRFQQGMAGITMEAYPACQRDVAFVENCHELATFCRRRHRLPAGSEKRGLLAWYRAACAQEPRLEGCRKYHFQRLQQAVAANVAPEPPLQPHTGFRAGGQLTLDFGEAEE